MRRSWILLVVAALALSGCAVPGRDIVKESRVSVSVSDPRYGNCIPKEKRALMTAMFEDTDDPPTLPRECGSSAQDEAMMKWDKCNDAYEGADIKKARAHAKSCEKNFPPPD